MRWVTCQLLTYHNVNISGNIQDYNFDYSDGDDGEEGSVDMENMYYKAKGWKRTFWLRMTRQADYSLMLW